MSANRLDEPHIIVVVDPKGDPHAADYAARRIAEEGIDWPIIIVDGTEGLAELRSSRETELANLRGVVERIEIKAERPKAPEPFLVRFRPAKDWEQRSRQRPRRKKRR